MPNDTCAHRTAASKLCRGGWYETKRSFADSGDSSVVVRAGARRCGFPCAGEGDGTTENGVGRVSGWHLELCAYCGDVFRNLQNYLQQSAGESMAETDPGVSRSADHRRQAVA